MMIAFLESFFLNPAVFATGAVAASIPIIIHILNRRRFKIREWAAMKFLLESVRKNRRRVQIEELILLALRTLVLVLLAMAIGRFTGCGKSNIIPIGTQGNAATIYVLDDSCSMGQKLGAATVFSSATTDLAEDIKKVPQGDTVGIILTSRPVVGDTAFLKATMFGDKSITDSVVSRLQGLKPSDAHTRIVDALNAAETTLADLTVANKTINIISDFRKVDFTRENNDALRKKVADLRKANVKIVVTDYGPAEGRDSKNNLTIENIELADKFVVAKQPANIRMAVRNNGRTSVQNVETRVRVRYPVGDELKEITVPVQTAASIEPSEVRNLEFQVKIPQAGAAIVTAEIGADDLLGDNVASLAVDARAAVRVLLVDGAYDLANPVANESFFFRFAMDPNNDGGYGNKADVISADGLSGARLDEYDVVVLLNVPSFPAATLEGGAKPYPQLANLETFVMNGGGLAIFTGDKINVEFYGITDGSGKGRFYNNGQGLLPLPLLAPPTDQRDEFYRLDSKSLAADSLLKVLLDLRREGQDPTRLIRFFSFNPAMEVATPATTQPIKPARVLARFNDPKNSPAIVGREYGKGMTVLFCTSASTRWTDWAIDEVGTYVATMNDLVSYLAPRQKAELTAKVGEPILCEVPSRFREARLTLKTPLYPAEEMVSLSAKQEDGRNVIHYDQQRTAGVYWLNMELPDKSRKDVLLAQNVDGIEGQLTAGHKIEIATAIGNEKDFVYVDRSGSAASNTVQAHSDKEYWMWALAAMLALMAAETFLGQRFGHYA